MNKEGHRGLSINLDELSDYNKKAIKAFIGTLLFDLSYLCEVSFEECTDIDGNNQTKLTVKNIHPAPDVSEEYEFKYLPERLRDISRFYLADENDKLTLIHAADVLKRYQQQT